jgi:hypothetical protein
LLRFSEKEDPAVEDAFSRHFVPLIDVGVR